MLSFRRVAVFKNCLLKVSPYHSFFAEFNKVVFLSLFMIGMCHAGEITIVSSSSPDSVERFAAEELKTHLETMYIADHFTLTDSLPTSGRIIWIGIAQKNQEMTASLDSEPPVLPESFILTAKKEENRDLLFIVGSDPRGLLYAVYRFLEQHGAGFYLSQDALPKRNETFHFENGCFRDEPLVKDRIVLNWHNFLSSCSTWNLPDWQHWILQSQKQGFNAVMIHLYGNNPIFRFSFMGQEKPLGYLATTAKGRDWATQHVLDVRKMWGGFAFDKAVFGSDAAMVPDSSRADAAIHLMSRVLDYADQRNMNVYIAFDIDTEPANPQNLIQMLDPADRFLVDAKHIPWMNQAGGKFWLANPDTPGGYAFYRAQVQSLLTDYPHLNGLVLWFRQQDTPWIGMKQEEMPLAWQTQFQEEIRRNPDLEKGWKPVSSFALSRMALAFQRALRDVGRPEISLSLGSWKFDFLDSCDSFLPQDIALMGLDSEILKGRSILQMKSARDQIARVAKHRAVIPFFWAHHDDGAYLGRPYTPPDNFADLLNEMSAQGFGIIHWTTRPLDLYFKSLSQQVWLASKNQPLSLTCDRMANCIFGSACRSPMGNYLYNWITEGPIIARETSVQFIDKKLTDDAIETVVRGCDKRLEQLAACKSCLPDAPQPQWNFQYFQSLEKTIQNICLHEKMLRHARSLLKENNCAAAVQILQNARVGEIIDQFAKACLDAGITRGEQGLIVSMNLRWLPHFVRLRQALGMEPIRYQFAPSSHEPLALARGVFTFSFDEDRNLWECLGDQETGLPVYQFPADEISLESCPAHLSASLFSSGIRCEKELDLTLQPILAPERMEDPDDLIPMKLPAGRFRLTLIFRKMDPQIGEKQILELQVPPSKLSSSQPIRIDLSQDSKTISVHECTLDLTEDGLIPIQLRPLAGSPILCALLAEHLGSLDD